jgi:mono/diheme cytochrome c family protein
MRPAQRSIRAQMLVFSLFVIIGAVACMSNNSGRYSITNSKAYEASLFRQNCAICHGREGEGQTLEDGRVIPNIRDGEHKYKSDEEIYNHIANGGNGMVPFRDQLTEREIRMMVQFVQKDLRQGK